MEVKQLTVRAAKRAWRRLAVVQAKSAGVSAKACGENLEDSTGEVVPSRVALGKPRNIAVGPQVSDNQTRKSPPLVLVHFIHPFVPGTSFPPLSHAFDGATLEKLGPPSAFPRVLIGPRVDQP